MLLSCQAKTKKLVRRIQDSVRKTMIVSLYEALGAQDPGIALDIFVYGSITLALFALWKILRIYRNRVIIPVYDESKGHHWNLIDILSSVVYCNICRGIIVDGMYCDLCGICADNNGCHQQADTTILCKSSAVESKGDEQKHHWVKGNLPDNSSCFVCAEDITEDDALRDYRCCWCQRIVHEDGECFEKLKAGNCDFGEYKRYIIPPGCVKYQNKWIKGKGKSKVVHSISSMKPTPDWRPLIVIGNRKSGSSDGERVLRAYRYILNPLQVIDTAESPPESGLLWWQYINKAHPDTIPWILVAGGDGTVAWVLETIEKLKLNPHPYVGIIPLGTGNDLAHVLGWDRFSSKFQIRHMMECMDHCEVVPLDRWKVKISPSVFGLSFSYKTFVMNNYLSIGVDALVALNFHQTRESKLYSWISSRFLNKVLYFGYGTKDVLERRCSLLNEKIALEIDGVRQELPQLESIVILNIPSWGGGVDIWSTNRSPDNPIPNQKFNDQLVEVIGLYSSLHIGQIIIGLSEPFRFGQAKKIKIKIFDQLPMQIDGEPWLQHPCTLQIEWLNQASMLKIEKD